MRRRRREESAIVSSLHVFCWCPEGMRSPMLFLTTTIHGTRKFHFYDLQTQTELKAKKQFFDWLIYNIITLFMRTTWVVNSMEVVGASVRVGGEMFFLPWQEIKNYIKIRKKIKSFWGLERERERGREKIKREREREMQIEGS